MDAIASLEIKFSQIVLMILLKGNLSRSQIESKETKGCGHV
jgi:hypothetical protein